MPKKWPRCRGVLSRPRVVDIEPKIAGDCPKFWKLERPTEIPHTHRDHRDVWRCSRVAAILLAQFLERKRDEIPEEAWDIPAPVSELARLGGDETISPTVPKIAELDLEKWKNLVEELVIEENIKLILKF
ncbi:unnamed protein product [Larinioides sclopetarius]|uniref:Uncharacterized protein n=1 Tax=Larinioides sclopetarius TaxID=280406 RepID=A0AAV1Z460_9ARAC